MITWGAGGEVEGGGDEEVGADRDLSGLFYLVLSEKGKGYEGVNQH